MGLLDRPGPHGSVVSPAVASAVSSAVSPAVVPAVGAGRRDAASGLPLRPSRRADINPSARPIRDRRGRGVAVGPPLLDCVVQPAGRPATVGLAVALPWFASAAVAARLVVTRRACSTASLRPAPLSALPSVPTGGRTVPRAARRPATPGA